MAGTYNRGKAFLANGNVDWDTTDIRAMLVTNGYVFNADHNFRSEAQANELTAGNYSVKSTTRTVVENDSSDRAELTCANILWGSLSATGTPAAVILYKHNDTPSLADLISFHEFTPTATNGGDFTVSFAGTNAILLT